MFSDPEENKNKTNKTNPKSPEAPPLKTTTNFEENPCASKTKKKRHLKFQSLLKIGTLETTKTKILLHSH